MAETKSIFERNVFYERLIDMRSTDRKTFDSLSQPTHWALLEYEKQKRAANELEAMRDEGSSTDVN
jgi:hypothetical protein